MSGEKFPQGVVEIFKYKDFVRISGYASRPNDCMVTTRGGGLCLARKAGFVMPANVTPNKPPTKNEVVKEGGSTHSHMGNYIL